MATEHTMAGRAGERLGDKATDKAEDRKRKHTARGDAGTKNPAYGRQRISLPRWIVAQVQKKSCSVSQNSHQNKKKFAQRFYTLYK